MKLSSWPKLPIITVMLIVTAVYLYLIWPQWFWAPVVGLVLLLLIGRR